MWLHLSRVFKAEKKTAHGGGLHYSFSASGDLGDNDIGFSYKPHTELPREKVGKPASTVTLVTTGIASGSITTGMAFVAFGDRVSAKVPMREKDLDFRGNASNNATNATSQTSGNLETAKCQECERIDRCG